MAAATAGRKRRLAARRLAPFADVIDGSSTRLVETLLMQLPRAGLEHDALGHFV
jgi:hypothetical protein